MCRACSDRAIRPTYPATVPVSAPLGASGAGSAADLPSVALAAPALPGGILARLGRWLGDANPWILLLVAVAVGYSMKEGR